MGIVYNLSLFYFWIKYQLCMFHFLDPRKNNIVTSTEQLLRLLKVKVCFTELRNTLEEHPDYPSFLSVTDSLKKWEVDSLGIKVPFDELYSLACPILVHFKTDQTFTIIGINNTSITYLNEYNKEKELSHGDFLKQWDGVALVAGADEKSGEIEYYKNRRKEILQKIHIPIALFVALILIILTAITAFRISGVQEIFPFLISLVMLSGVVISGLLLWYEIDKQNPVLQKICTANKHTNCSAILQSGAAKLWGLISWSEIGFAYFTGGFLSLLLSGLNSSVIEVVAWFNLLAAPYIFFSVFYQWKVARQWCVFCLTVQSLLLTGFIVSLIGKYYTGLPHNISMNMITLFVIAYGVPLFLWWRIKPLWLKAREGKYYKQELIRLKHDPRIFEALLAKQKNISLKEIQDIGISLGNPQAKHRLVKVCNPYCRPCSMAHPAIEDLLDNNADIQARIIYTAYDNEFDKTTPPVKHLLAIYEKGDEGITKKALDDWYLADNKDYELFAKKYPMNGELNKQREKIHAMRDWCDRVGIAFTPTIFVDGYQLPDLYSVTDLKYFIRD